ncbi:MAG TPA: F0F1 ATP synthase subunit [Lachnospiraceae bacterium]|nr:F0F1 ATP synthase subunit [Lachnospiraceae bacterium]
MKKEVIKALSLITQLGISMLVPIFACLIAGNLLDVFFKTGPLFMIIFIVLGVFAGFRSVYVLTASFHEKKDTYSLTSVEEDMKNAGNISKGVEDEQH